MCDGKGTSRREVMARLDRDSSDRVGRRILRADIATLYC